MILTLQVDYERSIEEGIKAGCYDWVSSKIIDSKFAVVRQGIKEVSILFLHFNKLISTDSVLKELQRKGYQPANLQELLSIGEHFPDIQRQFSIVALGSIYRSAGDITYAPCLSSCHLWRALYTYRTEGPWDEFSRFAVVLK